ncbi:hypothetical protein BABINDRAFT_161206 [Babjeviella inositovora NRRL Y-12698]|uniref:1-phosphatidylinositol 4-kinase n=1 Tax=Babjeviella inositovora NRRL Y-12698 TaxID=984486 RepID=A0A1E3QRB8_9ASCO|nr:uncharacterized protein BABINDRAFT_161206 [Babjeviella inositovora NRRL Y-12698]ODQ80239.1 hypothetical protein BABINDRAFT_161206 [Babjeviella inositovora NRRL Y-12698]
MLRRKTSVREPETKTEDFRWLKPVIDATKFDIFACVDYLQRYAHVIGIHNYLCRRLRSYPYEELEFFIPQFTQLLVNIETNSLALEEYILEYCEAYPHFSMLCFWNLQAHLFELAADTDSYSFQITRKMINSLQNLLFNDNFHLVMKHAAPAIKPVPIRENLYPSLVMASMVGAAAVAMPGLNDYAKPLIETQGKQERSMIFKLANFQKKLTKNLTLKNKKLAMEGAARTATLTEKPDLPHSASSPNVVTDRKTPPPASPLAKTTTSKTTSPLETDSNDLVPFDMKLENLSINTSVRSKKPRALYNTSNSTGGLASSESLPSPELNNESFHSLPELSKRSSSSVSLSRRSISSMYSDYASDSLSVSRTNSVNRQPSAQISAALMSPLHKTHFLTTNYYKKEYQFCSRLNDISHRLSMVPREARLSTLRAELSILNQDLPSEVDIPVLMPKSSTKKGKFNQILKLNINEAAVLNSAERVPFLLLVEYLADEIDFDPASDANARIIERELLATKKSKLNTAPDPPLSADQESIAGSVDFSFDSPERAVPETDLGDLNVVQISNQSRRKHGRPSGQILETFNRSRSASLHSVSEDTDSRGPGVMLEASQVAQPANLGEEGSRPSALSFKASYGAASPTNPADLAEQMRIAAVMLQQLETSASGALLSSSQSASIKNRIISSMQELQDKFENAHMTPDQAAQDAEAGNRKLENDLKVTGNNYLGEAWQKKRERIKNASPYGHLENWELCSVIVKNGDDLTQEAFACQLISMISLIWQKQKVPVWTKKMRILITSANHGLVETITDALSIHSIKKTLYEMKVKEGGDPRYTYATLKDHFEKSFGDPKSSAYRRAQDNFANSLAAYSVICYVLQIKDRHNGNIMLDNEGHVMHIDFGFLLSNSPGGMGFEAAPFKLPWEYVDLLGGVNGAPFLKFRDLVKQCYNCLSKNASDLVAMVELMQKDSALPCFKRGAQTSIQLKSRLMSEATDQQRGAFVDSYLIGKSMGSNYTKLYDQFQLLTQGIYS